MQFLKFMLASIVGVIISTIILTLIGIGIISAIVGSSQDKKVIVKENSILHMKLDREIVDRSSDNPFDNLELTSLKSEPKAGLNDILKCLKKAKDDKQIKGIYLELTSVPAGIATIEEIRNALIDFKSSKKFIICYSEYMTQGAYYLASVADKIYLQPEGLIEFKGLGAELMFYKGALEKLGVEPQVIRHGKFKSAIEPFILDKMSPENREQTMTYMNSIWNTVLKGISATRGIPVEKLTIIADSMSLKNAKAAEMHKFVDGLKYKDEIIAELKKLSGIDEKKDLNLISLGKYKDAPFVNDKTASKNKIAVIWASGEINMGKGDSKTIGSDGISEAIRKARLDESVKAIVLRVNSPGGSALASDIIWREVVLARKVKPVIASMGDVAASGGYYISCAADTIVASPNTITGSIGVFGLMFNGQKLLNEKLGITIDVAKTNAHSDIGSQYRKLSDGERAAIQSEVEQVYDVFITHVSEGRKITKEMVDSVGQGRVWSGENALNIKLVDVMGGLEKAIEIAAKKAKLNDYRLVDYPEKKDPFNEILMQISGESEAKIIKEKLGSNYKFYQVMDRLLNMQGIQARLPYEIEIK